jgi:predicted O-methyltransferase YrrM
MNVELPPNEILREILASGFVADADGRRRPLYAGISSLHATTLYQTVLKFRPKHVLEVGMCFGVSTLSILTALREINEGGRLISIDPLQTSNEKGIGLLNVRRAGLDSLHELIEKPSYKALPELLTKGLTMDFGYIDGSHIFDHALLDFFYIDKMMSPGAVIGFNDCGWRSIHHVVKFVQTHRKYEELHVGLSKNYRGRNPLFSILRWMERRSSADRYFKKIDPWEPEGSFFKRF